MKGCIISAGGFEAVRARHVSSFPTSYPHGRSSRVGRPCERPVLPRTPRLAIPTALSPTGELSRPPPRQSSYVSSTCDLIIQATGGTFLHRHSRPPTTMNNGRGISRVCLPEIQRASDLARSFVGTCSTPPFSRRSSKELQSPHACRTKP